KASVAEAVPKVPASLLVATAATGSSPASASAGSVRRPPPPAMASTKPEAKPARANMTRSRKDIPRACALRVVNPQSGAIIGDEHGQQACGLRRTGVFAHQMLAAGRLEERLAGAIHPGRSGGGVLRSDRARDDKGHDAAGMMMFWRFASWPIVDEKGG